MKPSIPDQTKGFIALLICLPLLYGTLAAQQPDGLRTVNTPHPTFPGILKSGATSSIIAEPVHESSWNPENLVRDIFLGPGSCAVISNVTYTGSNRAIGYFKRNPDNPSFPFEQGIILSTGKVSDATGPNNMLNITTEFSTHGDPDIDKIATPHPSYDASVLTFEFQPATSSLTFRYIFASDEYPEWACSQYNDVFGFFISGPGIVPDSSGFSHGAKNIALLPDGVTPVAINNIHVGGWNKYTHSGPNATCPDENAESYVAVAPGATSIEYDGRTVVLSATIDGLSPCSTYKLKLAIADVSDRKYDSSVFLEALSFDTGSDIQFKNFNFNGVETSGVFRSCNPNTLRIERTNGDFGKAQDITFTVSGSAVYNSHHTLQGGTVTIPAHQAYIDIPYNILDNPIPGGAATIIVETITGCLCDPDPVTISNTINLFDTYIIERITPVNTISCNDNPGSVTVSLNSLTPQFDFFFTYVLKDSGGEVIQAHSTQNTHYTFNSLQVGKYSVEVSDNATCKILQQGNININEDQVDPPALALNVNGILTCNVTEVTLTATSDGTVLWFFNNEPAGAGLSLSVSVPGTYTASAENTRGCITTKTIEVEQDTTPPVVTHDPVDPVCIDTLPLILGSAPSHGIYSGAGVIVEDGYYLFNPSTAGNHLVTYYRIGENGCMGSTTINVTVNPLPEVTLGAFGSVCSYSGAFALTGGLPEGGVYSGPGVTNNGLFDPVIAGSGIHTITYTYINPETGCANSATSPLHVSQALCLTVTSGNITCNGAGDGRFTVSVNCGSIKQLIVSGPGGFNYTSGETIQWLFENLVPGNYTVQGISAEGCKTQLDVEIIEPLPVSITLTGKNGALNEEVNDGSIEIRVAGGTPGYEILWDTGNTTPHIGNLAPGEYSVVVFDSNNCSAAASYEIINENPGKIVVDLGITVEVNIATPDPDHVDEIIFALVLKNHSRIHDATGVVVFNKLPAEFPFMQRLDDGTSGDYNPATGLWEVGTLPAGQYVILVYKTKMNLTRTNKSVSSAVNGAQILPFEQFDPNLLNNYAELVVTVGESTSADDNGIESNGNMASLIALRNHRRLVEPRLIPKEHRLSVMEAYTHSGMLIGKLKSALVDGSYSTGLQMLLPEYGPAQTRAFVSTPSDLLNITNAKEILAVDYLQANNSRRAAILAISTEPSRVYEHTKVICDRLTGAELQEVRMIEIAGKPFILSKLVHPNGYVDYSVSFIAQRNLDGFVVDTRWYNDQYNILNTEDIFNFQVWSVAPQLTRELVESLLDQLSQGGNISFHNENNKPAIPKVYVHSGRYTNGGLLLNLVNQAGADRITIKGKKTSFENSSAEPLNVSINIPTTEFVEVFVPTGYMFDAGFALTNNKDAAADVLYFADGAWMFDYDPGNSTVNKFETVAEMREATPNTLMVERDAAFSGTVRTYASMFRTLAPRQAPMDLSKYDMVVFEASGKGTVEVMLAKAGIHSWDEQYRSTITLNDKPQQFFVKFKDLANREGERNFRANDVVSVIFNALGNEKAETEYQVNIRNLHFANSQLAVNRNASFMPAYPNPFSDKTYLDMNITQAGHVKVEVLNLMGQVIEVLKDTYMEAGSYRLGWKPENQHSGVYIMQITIRNEIHTSKVIFNN